MLPGMLFLALASLALAPLLDAAARQATGGRAAGGMLALDAWMAVVASGVVLLEVMPEGIERLGVLSIVIAFVGAVLTSAAHHGGGDRWVSVAALVGLAAHSFLDRGGDRKAKKLAGLVRTSPSPADQPGIHGLKNRRQTVFFSPQADQKKSQFF